MLLVRIRTIPSKTRKLMAKKKKAPLCQGSYDTLKHWGAAWPKYCDWDTGRMLPSFIEMLLRNKGYMEHIIWDVALR